ncbi:hypothetical protein [Embleya sp. NPDC005575]|uniref:hypothetical protein n=1 Tax=Embleya sp. NPDC005575 TaxID=3156892 RepID=UPI0033AEDACF
MTGRSDRQQIRSRRMTEAGAEEAYEAARIAFELGRSPTIQVPKRLAKAPDVESMVRLAPHTAA